MNQSRNIKNNIDHYFTNYNVKINEDIDNLIGVNKINIAKNVS